MLRKALAVCVLAVLADAGSGQLFSENTLRDLAAAAPTKSVRAALYGTHFKDRERVEAITKLHAEAAKAYANADGKAKESAKVFLGRLQTAINNMEPQTRGKTRTITMTIEVKKKRNDWQMISLFIMLGALVLLVVYHVFAVFQESMNPHHPQHYDIDSDLGIDYEDVPSYCGLASTRIYHYSDHSDYDMDIMTPRESETFKDFYDELDDSEYEVAIPMHDPYSPHWTGKEGLYMEETMC